MTQPCTAYSEQVIESASRKGSKAMVRNACGEDAQKLLDEIKLNCNGTWYWQKPVRAVVPGLASSEDCQIESHQQSIYKCQSKCFLNAVGNPAGGDHQRYDFSGVKLEPGAPAPTPAPAAPPASPAR